MQNKTAQQLKKRHKARRLVNPTGAALSALNPAFKKVIRQMDKVDKKVRSEAEDINYYIGMAKSFYRRKDYLSSATYLTKIHEKIKSIHHQLNAFNGDISQSNRKFLLRQFKNRDKKQLFEYDPEKKLEDVQLVNDGSALISTAGVVKDWWRTPGRFSDIAHNLTDRRSRSMRAMESNFSDAFLSKLKEDTEEILIKTNDLYKNLLNNFHNMGSAWATRNVGAYLKEVSDINSLYKPYHTKYVKYYKDNIAPMKEEQEKIDAEEKTALQEARKKSLENGAFYKEKDPFEAIQEPPSTLDGQTVVSPLGPDTQETDLAYQNTQRPLHSQPSFRGFKSDALPAPESPITQKSPVFKDEKTMPSMQAIPQSSIRERTNRHYPPPHSAFPKVPTQKAFPAPPANPPSLNGPFTFNGPPGKNYSDIDHLMEYDLTKRKANEDFINRIEKLSSEDEIIKEILAYSEEVEKYSEEESLKLLSVAEGMLEKKAGIFDTIKKKLNPKPEDQPKDSIWPPKPAPKSEVALESKEDLLPQLAPKNRLEPVNHGIPSGKIEKRWFDIPFLAQKSSEDILLSPNTANLIVDKIAKYLHHKYIPYQDVADFENKLAQAVKKSITRGQLLSNMACGDRHNGRDCQLEIFSYIKLRDIDQSPIFQDLALSFTATCRLSTFEGDITIGKITNPKLHNVSK